jgi:hypothetical protein
MSKAYHVSLGPTKGYLREVKRGHFSLKEIRAAEHTSEGTTRFTKNDVKMETYLRTTTCSLRIYIGK